MNSDRKNILAVVAANVQKCLDSGLGPSSEMGLGKKIKGGQSTIGRILSGENNTRIGTLDRIAEVYGLDVWQLLVPDLGPKNPPVLRSVSPAEDALYERLRETVESINAVKREKP